MSGFVYQLTNGPISETYQRAVFIIVSEKVAFSYVYICFRHSPLPHPPRANVAGQAFRRWIISGKECSSTGCYIALFWALRSRQSTPPPLLVCVARRSAIV